MTRNGKKVKMTAVSMLHYIRAGEKAGRETVTGHADRSAEICINDLALKVCIRMMLML